MERLTIKNSDGTYSQPTHTTFEKMFYKLAKFEDFMEELGFEDLEDLERYISQSIKAGLIINKKRQENQELKDRWQKLKEFIVKEQGYASMYQEERIEALDDVKDKMQELEDGKDINVPSNNAPYTEQKSAKDAQ